MFYCAIYIESAFLCTLYVDPFVILIAVLHWRSWPDGFSSVSHALGFLTVIDSSWDQWIYQFENVAS